MGPLSAAVVDAVDTELRTHGSAEEGAFYADEEGRRRLRKSITYERSLKNRLRALQIHGTKCLACDFDFDAKYGTEHAASYIEVHHVRSIASGRVTPDPATDLIPLCSNCHSMAHRRKGMCLGLQELRALVR